MSTLLLSHGITADIITDNHATTPNTTVPIGTTSTYITVTINTTVATFSTSMTTTNTKAIDTTTDISADFIPISIKTTLLLLLINLLYYC